MAVLIIFPIIPQTVINVRMLSIGEQRGGQSESHHKHKNKSQDIIAWERLKAATKDKAAYK